MTKLPTLLNLVAGQTVGELKHVRLWRQYGTRASVREVEMSHHLPGIGAYGRLVDLLKGDGALPRLKSKSKPLCSSSKVMLAFLKVLLPLFTQFPQCMPHPRSHYIRQ